MHFTGISILVLLAFAPRPLGTNASMKDRTDDSDALRTSKIEVVQAVKSTADAPIVNKLITTFREYVGIKESPVGSNNGPLINKFNASCGLDPKEHAPWCASVTNYGYKLNGLRGRGAYSPDWFDKSRRVDQVRVAPADVALVFFTSKGRYAHTIAAVEKVTFSAGRVVQVQTLEGNTNAQGSREGDQFARRVRPADTLTFVRWWNQ